MLDRKTDDYFRVNAGLSPLTDEERFREEWKELDQDSRDIAKIADRQRAERQFLALANQVPVLDDALGSIRQSRSLTPDQAASLAALRDELVKAIHLAWGQGLSDGPAGKSKVEAWLQAELRRWASLARAPAYMVESEVQDILQITYPGKPAATGIDPTAPGGSGSPSTSLAAFPGAAVSASQTSRGAGGGPFLTDLRTGRPVDRPMYLKM